MGKPSKLPKWIFICGIAVTAVWFVFFLCKKADIETLTPLFSGWAFAVLVGTLISQRQELKDTRKANKQIVEMSRRNIEAQYILYMLKLIGPQEEDRRKAYLDTSSKETSLAVRKRQLEREIENITARKELGHLVDTELTAAEALLAELIPHYEGAQKATEITKKHWMEYDTLKTKFESLIKSMPLDE